jgi:hypothetical protein
MPMAKHRRLSLTQFAAVDVLKRWTYALLWLALQSDCLAQSPGLDAAADADAKPASASTPSTDAASAPPPPANQPPSVRLRRAADKLLASVKAPPNAISIAVKDEEVLGFWSPDSSGKPVGAILLLHDNAESPRKPDTLFKLHRVLPKFGWAILSIQLPPMSPRAVPPRTRQPLNPAASGEATANSAGEATNGEGKGDEAKANEPKVDETKVVFQDEEAKAGQLPKADGESALKPAALTNDELIQASLARVQAAVSYLQQQNQYNIVVLGEGLGAVFALKSAEQAQTTPGEVAGANPASGSPPIRALVLLNADFSDLPAETPEKLLQQAGTATLDLTASVDPAALDNAKMRKQISLKKGYKIYVSRQLAPLYRDLGDDQEDLVTKYIRGFLAQHARGVAL